MSIALPSSFICGIALVKIANRNVVFAMLSNG
jgi:hypothetical protein